MKQGERIRTIRKIRGMTCQELGIRVGFPDTTAGERIAQYENGYRTPKKEMILKLAETMDVTPAMLDRHKPEDTEQIMRSVLLASLDEKTFEEERSRHIAWLMEWEQMSRLFLNNRISRKEFMEWKLHWDGKLNTDRKFRSGLQPHPILLI